MAKKTDIRLRRSNVANAIPGHANLSDGELAINTMDGALYFKKSNNTIITAHDDTIMHIDSDNSRVGIGEASPTHKLHVAGDAKITGPILEGPATSNVYSYASHFSASSASIQITFGRETNSTGTGAIAVSYTHLTLPTKA